MGEIKFNIVTSGEPSFTFTASPTEITPPPFEVSDDIVFTLTAVDGFAGEVEVSWTSDGGTSPVPNTNPFTINLVGTQTFTRGMLRLTTHSLDDHVTFTAKDPVSGLEKSVVITVHAPE